MKFIVFLCYRDCTTADCHFACLSRKQQRQFPPSCRYCLVSLHSDTLLSSSQLVRSSSFPISVNRSVSFFNFSFSPTTVECCKVYSLHSQFIFLLIFHLSDDKYLIKLQFFFSLLLSYMCVIFGELAFILFLHIEKKLC